MGVASCSSCQNSCEDGGNGKGGPKKVGEANVTAADGFDGEDAGYPEGYYAAGGYGAWAAAEGEAYDEDGRAPGEGYAGVVAEDGSWQFDVELWRDSEDGGGAAGYGFGYIELEKQPNMLLVVSVREDSAVARWNAQCQEEGMPDYAIKAGDKIIGVNGAQDAASMREELHQSEGVGLVVQRMA
mmetsp:Transcript_1648/g.4072  ORF Transcript_1648/g.4072 Transcript_1648/m.4072 type:complete len:184 (-) Transcript_1648:336-887(-)